MRDPRALSFRARPRRGRAAAWLLFLPGISLLVFALWQRTRPSGPGAQFQAPVVPERTARTGDVAGWERRVARGGGGELVVRLERLHPFSSRQAFDAATLASRLRPASDPRDVSGGAQDGAEPWRLTLSVASSAEDVGDVVVESLGSIRVDGMEPLVHPDAPVATSGDPLAALFTPPAEPLREGQACDLVFWGPAPRDGARVLVTGLGTEVELLPMTRAGSQASLSIATLDARAPKGKGR